MRHLGKLIRVQVDEPELDFATAKDFATDKFPYN